MGTRGGSRPLIRNAILIAGPTASGKSALALELARRFDGLIVNADSMQVYRDLNVLTARPDREAVETAPHALYGHVDAADAQSVGAWLRDVARVHSEAPDRRMIFVGGTGLYLRALIQGFSEMPDIPPHLRERWRWKLHEEGAARLHKILRLEDPEMAERLRPNDGQRIIRALEVLEASGRSILDWQLQSEPPLIDKETATLRILEIDRTVLIDRIDKRFDRMVSDGAIEEVTALLARKLDPALPIMKAIGVREFGDVLAGHAGLSEAIEHAKIATRQYARRQSTWFRNQFGPDWARISAPGEK